MNEYSILNIGYFLQFKKYEFWIIKGGRIIKFCSYKGILMFLDFILFFYYFCEVDLENGNDQFIFFFKFEVVLGLFFFKCFINYIIEYFRRKLFLRGDMWLDV